MALNRVKTLARTISHSDRLVPPGARLTRPSAIRSATSAAVRPVGSADRVTLGAVTARRVPTRRITAGSAGTAGRAGEPG